MISKEECIGINIANKDDIYCTAEEFEKDVYAVESIRIILRCPKSRRVLKYSHKKEMNSKTTVNEFIKAVSNCINNEIEIEVIYPVGYNNDADNDKLNLFDLRILDPKYNSYKQSRYNDDSKQPHHKASHSSYNKSNKHSR